MKALWLTIEAGGRGYPNEKGGEPIDKPGCVLADIVFIALVVRMMAGRMFILLVLVSLTYAALGSMTLQRLKRRISGGGSNHGANSDMSNPEDVAWEGHGSGAQPDPTQVL